MLCEIIKYGDYLLILDNSEVKGGDWVLANLPNSDFYGIVKWIGDFTGHDIKKIIAHLPLQKTKLDGIEVLPLPEDNLIPKFFDFEDRKYLY